MGGEKRDMWWLLTASYTKQFNENSRAKPQTYGRREKWLLTASHTKQFNENSHPKVDT